MFVLGWSLHHAMKFTTLEAIYELQKRLHLLDVVPSDEDSREERDNDSNFGNRSR